MEKKKPRITIKDLPKDMKVSEEEMKLITGGFSYQQLVTGMPSSGGFFSQQLAMRGPISGGYFNQRTPSGSPRIPEFRWGNVALECESRCRGFGI